MKPIEPIIFIGMHRSGTSMLLKLLEDLGLFIGFKRDKNNESLLFRDINEWILDHCGGRWDTPHAVNFLWENKELIGWMQDYVHQLLSSPRSIQFLGIQQYLRNKSVARINVPWGWKDPRNTFTLPFWLLLFPGAKIIHIKRHGVDVAQSLVMRNRKGLKRTTSKYLKHKWIIPYRPKRGGFIESPRCWNLAGAFSLWQEYLNQAELMISQNPTAQVLTVRYEDILLDPIPNMINCADFCNLLISRNKLEILTSQIDASRAYAYKKNPELVSFCETKMAELSERGYHEAG